MGALLKLALQVGARGRNEPAGAKLLRVVATPAANRSIKTEPTLAQRLELSWLVSVIHGGEPERVIAECVQDALARPEAALECYRALYERRLAMLDSVGPGGAVQ